MATISRGKRNLISIFSPLHLAASTAFIASTPVRTKANMSAEDLCASIIIVSETASKDPSTDKCVPALQEVLASDGDGRFVASDTVIVPDDAISIQRAITERTDRPQPPNLIVTSGGTGFTTKDVTPEVGLAVLFSEAISLRPYR